MYWQCEALVICADGASRRIVVGSTPLGDWFEGRVVWAVEPGRGASVGRIAVEEISPWQGYVVRVDGTVVQRTHQVEKALRVASCCLELWTADVGPISLRG